MSTNGALPHLKTALTAPSQPQIGYDLLLPRSKSPSFVVMFHMEFPQYRFVILHRAVFQRLWELDDEERCELIRVAATFTKDFELSDTTLTIPFGKANLAPRRDHPFYAFLEVPCRMAFIKAFRALLSELPLNYDKRWHTPLWPPLRFNEEIIDCYMRAVTELPEEKLPLQPKLTDRFHSFDFARHAKKKQVDTAVPQTWTLVQHPSLPLVGVAGEQSTDSWTLKNRLEALNQMETFLRKHHVKEYCYLCISLTGVYRFPVRLNQRPIAYIYFPKGIPYQVIEHVVRTKPKNTNETYKDVIDGPLPPVEETPMAWNHAEESQLQEVPEVSQKDKCSIH